MMGIFFNRFLLILLYLFQVLVAVKSESETEVVKELPLQYVVDNSLGFQGSFSSDVDFPPSTASSTVIKKCCPWGAFFDTESLTCEIISDKSKTGNFTSEELQSMERSFLKLYLGNLVGDYEFSIGVLPCDDTKVFTSQVSTEFTIENGVPKLEGKTIKEEYCIDGRRGKGTVLLRCHHESVCKSRPCIRKCKPFGDFFGRDEEGVLELPRMTKDFYNLKTLEVDRLVTISVFGVYMGNTCGGRGRNKLSPDIEPRDKYFLGSDGRLYVPDGKQQYYTNEEFCIEYIKDDEDVSDVHAFLCFPEPTPAIKFYLLAGCFLISCVFLLATFLVYLFSPKTQILYGKSLMCYVASLFSAYLTLAIIQINADNMKTEDCTFAGYSTLFFFLAAFFWLNIMSFDMWKTFRSTRLARFNKSKGNIQFLWYSLYAWTIPVVLTGLTAAADFVPNFVPPTLRPGIGDPSCWFSSYSKGIHVFFIIPVSLVIICNTALFIDTAWRCWKIKSEIIRMGSQSKKKYAANKTQLIINLKLFIAMGVVWSLEIISFFFNHPIWYISDAANALHGVFIFAVFVMKKKVLAGLHHRIQKPFIRMKNIKKKGLDESGVLEDTTVTTTTSGRKKHRSSSNLTEAVLYGYRRTFRKQLIPENCANVECWDTEACKKHAPKTEYCTTHISVVGRKGVKSVC